MHNGRKAARSHGEERGGEGRGWACFFNAGGVARKANGAFDACLLFQALFKFT